MSDRQLAPRVLCIALAAVMVSASAFGDARESYTEGIRAMDKGQWQEAARWMQRAIDEDPAESDKRVRLYGMRFEPYLPHYQLGVALQEAGDCRGALAAWAESERQGVIQSSDKYRDLEERRAECRASLPPPTAAPTRAPAPAPTPTTPPFDTERFQRLRAAAEEAISRAESAARDASRLRESSDYAQTWRRNPQLATRHDEAGESLAVAKAKLASGVEQRSFEDLEDAQRLAARADESLRGVVSSAQQVRTQIEQEQRRQREAALERLRQDVRQLLPGAREALAATDGLSSAGRRQVSDTRAELERVVGQAEGIPDSLGPAELEQLRARLERAVRTHRDAVSRRLAEENKPVPPTPTPLPTVTPLPAPSSGLPDLRSGVEAFLQGEYDRAVESLQAESLAVPRQAAVAFLVRAASRYYLYVEGGEADRSLLEGAVADIESCRREDAGVSPLPELFSPRFVELFDAEG